MRMAIHCYCLALLSQARKPCVALQITKIALNVKTVLGTISTGLTHMLRLGRNIRLTSREIDRFTEITGFSPLDVKTIDDLDAYVDLCKRHYWGVSQETRFLHWLIDRERLRCLGSL